MRASEKILMTLALVGGFCLLLFVAPFFSKSDYLRFMEDMDRQYYFKLARGCDVVLTQHPIGTNSAIRIPGNDSSLPEIIRDLGPEQITISSNRVHIMVGAGRRSIIRGGFGISWEPQSEGQTNSWAINTFPEGPPRVAYVEMR